jgi:hypothetical protein
MNLKDNDDYFRLKKIKECEGKDNRYQNFLESKFVDPVMIGYRMMK